MEHEIFLYLMVAIWYYFSRCYAVKYHYVNIMEIMRSSKFCVIVQSFMRSKVRINWYQALYRLGDEDLISQFWKRFNFSKLSKNRCARYVLLHYCSTTSDVPEWLLKLFSLKHDVELCKVNLYELL